MYMSDQEDKVLVCAANQDNDGSEQQGPVSEARNMRVLLFYLLYASYAQDYQVSLDSILENLERGFDVNVKDERAKEIAASIIEQKEQLDTFLVPLLDKWRLERIGVCTHIILWIGLWELMHTDTDSKIIINEAIELAKCFAEKDAYRFVNGILDQAIKKLERPS